MSKDKETFRFITRNGKVAPAAYKGIQAKLNSLEGILTEVTIGAVRKTRSTPQNRYWWGRVVDDVRKRFIELGHRLDEDEVHEFLKGRSKVTAEKVIDPESGEVIANYIKSTTKLSTTEFRDLVADTQQWAAEILDIVIPDPQEQF